MELYYLEVLQAVTPVRTFFENQIVSALQSVTLDTILYWADNLRSQLKIVVGYIYQTNNVTIAKKTALFQYTAFWIQRPINFRFSSPPSIKHSYIVNITILRIVTFKNTLYSKIDLKKELSVYSLIMHTALLVLIDCMHILIHRTFVANICFTML